MIIYSLSLVPTHNGPELVTLSDAVIYQAFRAWAGDPDYNKTQEQFISELTSQRFVKHKDVVANCHVALEETR